MGGVGPLESRGTAMLRLAVLALRATRRGQREPREPRGRAACSSPAVLLTPIYTQVPPRPGTCRPRPRAQDQDGGKHAGGCGAGGEGGGRPLTR